MENMEIWNMVCNTPDNAKKTIGAGRLKGFTDIKPMYRIDKLTQIFGACGIGWYIELLEKRLEKADNGEIIAIVDINLYYKYNGEWSKPVFGTGGNKFVAKESNGLYVSDECYKMAFTDAISVACKHIGIGADVYYGDKGDRTKYTDIKPTYQVKTIIGETQVKVLQGLFRDLKENGKPQYDLVLKENGISDLKELTTKQYTEVLLKLKKLLGE